MMKKLGRSIFAYFMIIAISVPYFFEPLAVEAATKSNANTLAELRKELASYEAKYKAAQQGKAQTNSQINANKNTIANSQVEIENNKKIIEKSKQDIEKLTKEIADTKDKIEDIMRTYEVTDGDNLYLNYVFNADSISDFIIRYGVSEQIAKYNQNLLESYRDKVAQNAKLQADLNQREKDLNNTINNLNTAIEKLGDNLKSYIDEAISAQDDINSTKQLINYYKNMGCGENEDFNKCVAVRADKQLIRPLTKGYISSPFGYRTHPVTKQPYKFHTGTDLAGNKLGTPVYASAKGMVGKIIKRASCGGNQVYIFHVINGVKYTTGYMHLHKINVKVGDSVTNTTVIGTVGGNESYEKCSTGPHLHFMVGKGWYGSTYVSYSTWVSNLVNPVTKVKFPSNGSYWYTRM